MDRSVLVASSDWRLRRVVRTAIKSDRYELREAGSYGDAWAILNEERPAVAVVDVQLGGRGGLELCRTVRDDAAIAQTRLILIGGLDTPNADLLKVDAFLARPFSPRELLRHVERLLEPRPRRTPTIETDDPDEARRARANVRLAYAFRLSESPPDDPATVDPVNLARAIDDAQQIRLVEDFREAYEESVELAAELRRAYQQTITALAKAVEARDLYTGGHVERVRRYSLEIGRRLGLGGDQLREIGIGAVLHDVGKIGVPDAVLTKPGPLAPEEWRVMRRHPEIGRDMLRDIGFLSNSLDAVTHHHERWDGGGYPGGLSKQAIPIAGRIVAVADAFDAMTTTRVYRRGLDKTQALNEITTGRGKGFDPDVVDAFLEVAA